MKHKNSVEKAINPVVPQIDEQTSVQATQLDDESSHLFSSEDDLPEPEHERHELTFPSESELFEAREVLSTNLEDSLGDVQTTERNNLPAPTAGALVPYDPLESYLSEIRRIPSLTREEEHQLAVRYFETKDKVAAYKLVASNLRLVVMIAREYQRNFQNILDLIQEGNLGLLEAVEQYDPFRGIRFPSYAVYWIRAYMLRYLINNLRLVKIGTTQAQRKLFFNLQKEKEKLEAEGYAPEANLLAKRLQVKESEVIEMEQRLALPDLSVDTPIGDGESAGTLHGILPDLSANVEDRVTQEEFANALRHAVSEFKERVDEKERAIIEQRLFTDEPVTLQLIAEQFGLSRERIRQIENRLKQQLKNYLAERLQLGEQGEVLIDDE